MVLSRLSHRVSRNVGRKALALGGNAVLGYAARFDFEEEATKCLAARAVGCACQLQPVIEVVGSPAAADLSVFTMLTPSPFTPLISPRGGGVPYMSLPPSVSAHTPALVPLAASPTVAAVANEGQKALKRTHRSLKHDAGVELITMRSLPVGMITKLGGVVSARAVKLLDSKSSDLATHDEWWIEIRDEVRSHARSLSCSAVIGYSETTSIFEEICILSASGTAAVLTRSRANIMNAFLGAAPHPNVTKRRSTAPRSTTPRTSADSEFRHSLGSNTGTHFPLKQYHGSLISQTQSCQMCHIPYNPRHAPFKIHYSPCCICGQHRVPEILLGTVEPPHELP
eukprot:81348_1